MSKCNCVGKKAYCSTHSKVKMVVMLKDEYKNTFKTRVFYCYLKHNKKPEATIVIGMIDRLEKDFKNAFNCIIFFNNKTDTKIHVHK